MSAPGGAGHKGSRARLPRSNTGPARPRAGRAGLRQAASLPALKPGLGKKSAFVVAAVGPVVAPLIRPPFLDCFRRVREAGECAAGSKPG